MRATITDIVSTPLWLAQLVTGAKSFRDNPVMGSRRLNQMGLHAFRRRTADRMAAHRRRGLARLLSTAERQAFDEQGFVVRRHALEEGLFRALRRQAEDLKVVAREMRQGGTVTRRIGLDRNLLMTWPAARAVVEDPSIRGLIHYAGSYAGEPTYQIQSVMAAAGPNGDDPQTQFHSDTFHPTAKAWLFLDDVAEDGGPLAYIPGSHRLNAARLEWEREQSLTARVSRDRMHAEGSFRISDSDRAALGLAAPVCMSVPANTLVVADTSGFHARSPSLRPSHRVEIYATFRRSPFLPWVGGHLLALPFVSGRHAAIEMGLQRLFASARFGRGSWTIIDGVSPYDPPTIIAPAAP
ncbi:phytanoyl-CoA dioxygenase family protein [Dongia sp.]|uniref:phytanoyl-CoA dioxygenase family protein n=1 Tax=Dongia sp. TaxID=1977262 RepID=UPI0037513004